MAVLKNTLFLRVLLMATLMGPVISANVFAVTPNDSEVVCRNFLGRLKQAFVGEDLYKPSYSYRAEEYSDAKKFIETENSGIALSGFNPKMAKLQELALKRYARKVDPQAIHAFGVNDNFRMSNGTMKASVTLKVVGDRLVVNVANIGVKSIGKVGNISSGLDVNLAQFFASVRKGVEYRLSLSPAISKVEITAKDVMNVKLQKMLEELNFEKIPGAIPEWAPIKGYEGTNAPSDFKIYSNVVRTREP